MNIRVLCTTDFTLQKNALFDGMHFSVRAGLEYRFSSFAGNHSQTTSRFGVIVNLALLAIFPANTQKLVPGVFANQVPAVTVFTKMHKRSQVIQRDIQLSQLTSQVLNRNAVLVTTKGNRSVKRGIRNCNSTHWNAIQGTTTTGNTR